MQAPVQKLERQHVVQRFRFCMPVLRAYAYPVRGLHGVCRTRCGISTPAKIAQRVEQLMVNQLVAGSNPALHQLETLALEKAKACGSNPH